MNSASPLNNKNENFEGRNVCPYMDLLQLHEQTILGNCSFIDVLEKEACVVNTSQSNEAMAFSPHPVDQILLTPSICPESGLSPIAHVESPNCSRADLSRSCLSPILSGPFKRNTRKLKKRRLSDCIERRDSEGSSHIQESEVMMDMCDGSNSTKLRKSLMFSSPSQLCEVLRDEQTGSPDLFQERDESIEEGRPWDYSVHVSRQQNECDRSKNNIEEMTPPKTSLSVKKSPNSSSSLADESSPAKMQSIKQSNATAVEGISKLINSVFRTDHNPDQFLNGLSLIDWDESMCLNKVSFSDGSPLSVPFSEKLHQQLLFNNQNCLTANRPSIVKYPPAKDTSFYGLPLKVKTLFQKFRGIQELYDWQNSCLSMPALLERCNLVYALPTSGGKTLVAEVLLLKELLISRKNCLFILPYVAIVQEKVKALSQFAVELDFYVEEYASGKGAYPPRRRRCRNSVYVATIEKALGLVHCLIRDKRLHELGLVVVDELHLLGDGSRGATLEAVLSQLIFAREKVQLVGMSATIGNLDEIATFLDAKTFTGNFRPVELLEYIKCGSTLYSINRDLIGTGKSPLTVQRTVFSNYGGQQLQNDPDQIGTLVGEVIPEASCLIFCPSRKNCENVALLVCATLPRSLLQIRCEEKRALYKALAAEGNGIVCPVIVQTLPFGVVYHHSGLTTAERRLLEEAFLAKTICVICCTSTLAAGVNLPAKRVILRSPYIGTDFIDLSRYKQMVGRAGRAGFGGTGESILMCHSQDCEKVLQLLTSSMNESLSCLAEAECAGMKSLIMSSVSLAQVSCRSDAHNLIKHTLLWVQAQKLGINGLKLADKCIIDLLTEGAFSIERKTVVDTEIDSEAIFFAKPQNSPKKEEELLPIGLHCKVTLSRVAEAAVKGSLTMTVALQLYGDLKIAQEKMVLLNHLHLLYIVTPYNMSHQIKTVNQVLFNVYMALKPDEVKGAHAVGLSEAVVISLVRGRPVRTVSQEVINRFYSTLILYDLWNEKSVWEVSTKFQVPRGQIHNLLVAASAFASSVLRFSEALEEFWCYKVLLAEMTQRLSHCCSTELLPLMELPAVKIGRARQLYNAGFRSLSDIAKADPLHIVRQLDHMPRKTAYQIVAAAKLLLMDRAEALREEASDVLEGLARGISTN